MSDTYNPITEILPDGLEHIFKDLDSSRRQPMTTGQATFLLQIMLLERNMQSLEKAYKEFKKDSWVLQAVEKRIDGCLTVKISKAVQMYIVYHVDGIIGSALMYVYYMQFWATFHGKGLKEITYQIFMSRIFPRSFFSEKDMQKIWDKQKVDREICGGSDNLIDYTTAAKTILFGPVKHK